MPPRYQKVWRDLLLNKGRTSVVVLAIAVGVIAFGGVFATKTILLSDMAKQYMAIKPSNISLTISSGFDAGLVKQIESQPGVLKARPTGTALVRIFTPNGANNLILTALDDYEVNAINLITPEKGEWPPKRKEIILERKSAELLGYNIGETIEVENSQGRKKKLIFAGTIHDLKAIPANLFPQYSGYATFDTFRYLEEQELLTTIEVRSDSSITTLEQSERLGKNLKNFLENRGFTNVSVKAEKPDKHWGEDPSNAFVTILTVIGSFSLILSVFLVYNTVSAIIVQQRKQIGIMKAVGAKRSQIICLFVIIALSYGFLSMLVSLPLGALMAYGCLSLVANFLNISILSFSIPPSVIAIEIFASLGVPLLAALIPVWFGTKITVKEAIGDIAATATTKAMNLKFISRPLTISLRNTFRQKNRLILTLITLTMAGTIFIAVVGVRESLNLELKNIMKLYNYDLELFFGDTYDKAKVIADTKKTTGVLSIETPINLSTKETPGLTGVSPDSSFMVPTITSGRWLNNNDTNKIVVSSKFTRDDSNVKVGSNLYFTINEDVYAFEIVGIFTLDEEKQVLINEKHLTTLSPDTGVSSVRVRTVGVTPKQLEQDLKIRGYNVAYSLTIDSIRASSQGQFDFLIFFLLLMSALIAVVGGLGLAGTMSLNVLERTREIGVMRSIGASNGAVFRLVLIESLFIGWISGFLAIPLAIPIGYGFSYALGIAFGDQPLEYIFSISSVGIWFLIISIISIIASFAPAKNAVSLTVRDTLSYE